MQGPGLYQDPESWSPYFNLPSGHRSETLNLSLWPPRTSQHLGQTNSLRENPKAPGVQSRPGAPDHQGQLTTAPSLHVPKLSMTPVLFNKDVSMAFVCRVTGGDGTDPGVLLGCGRRKGFARLVSFL